MAMTMTMTMMLMMMMMLLMSSAVWVIARENTRITWHTNCLKYTYIIEREGEQSGTGEEHKLARARLSILPLPPTQPHPLSPLLNPIAGSATKVPPIHLVRPSLPLRRKLCCQFAYNAVFSFHFALFSLQFAALPYLFLIFLLFIHFLFIYFFFLWFFALFAMHFAFFAATL